MKVKTTLTLGSLMLNCPVQCPKGEILLRSKGKGKAIVKPAQRMGGPSRGGPSRGGPSRGGPSRGGPSGGGGPSRQFNEGGSFSSHSTYDSRELKTRQRDYDERKLEFDQHLRQMERSGRSTGRGQLREIESLHQENKQILRHVEDKKNKYVNMMASDSSIKLQDKLRKYTKSAVYHENEQDVTQAQIVKRAKSAQTAAKWLEQSMPYLNQQSERSRSSHYSSHYEPVQRHSDYGSTISERSVAAEERPRQQLPRSSDEHRRPAEPVKKTVKASKFDEQSIISADLDSDIVEEPRRTTRRRVAVRDEPLQQRRSRMRSTVPADEVFITRSGEIIMDQRGDLRRQRRRNSAKAAIGIGIALIIVALLAALAFGLGFGFKTFFDDKNQKQLTDAFKYGQVETNSSSTSELINNSTFGNIMDRGNQTESVDLNSDNLEEVGAWSGVFDDPSSSSGNPTSTQPVNSVYSSQPSTSLPPASVPPSTSVPPPASAPATGSSTSSPPVESSPPIVEDPIYYSPPPADSSSDSNPDFSILDGLDTEP